VCSCQEILRRNGRGQPKGGLEACFRGDLAAAQQLAADGWGAAHAVCQQASTAVHWAASGGHMEVLRWLVAEPGACDVNATNKVGRTALMFAAKYGHCECLRWLVEEAGADISIHAADDSDVLAWAVFGGDIATLETVASLLPAGAMHHRNRFGCTAIHWAAASGNVAVLKWLYTRGLDFGVINDAHHGAVNKAAWKGHKAALEWLLLDESGPCLLWQLLRPTLAMLDGTMPSSLGELVTASGLSGVREWLEANARECYAQARVCTC
jgi:hypothetical protein